MNMESGDERARRILRGYDRVVSPVVLHRMIVSAYSAMENKQASDALAPCALHGPHELAVMRSVARAAIAAL